MAVALMLYAGLGLYADLAGPKLRADDLFNGRLRAEGGAAAAPSAIAGALLSFSGDFLAGSAVARTEQVLDRPALAAAARTADNQAAQGAVVAALRVSPVRPTLWLALATLRGQANEPVLPALKASYLSGAVSADAAFSRLQAVTSGPAASDEEIRLLALSDIRSVLANRSRFEAPLIAAYVQASDAGRALLLESTQAVDPKFSELLRRY